VLEPESATTNTLPKIKRGLRIAPFHDGSAASERYLVEVGETLPAGTADYVEWINGQLDALGVALDRP